MLAIKGLGNQSGIVDIIERKPGTGKTSGNKSGTARLLMAVPQILSNLYRSCVTKITANIMCTKKSPAVHLRHSLTPIHTLVYPGG